MSIFFLQGILPVFDSTEHSYRDRCVQDKTCEGIQLTRLTCSVAKNIFTFRNKKYRILIQHVVKTSIINRPYK